MATRTQDDSRSAFIPNSFQCPNVYADQFLHLLAPEEWVVLTYAIRRTFGFWKRADAISLSQFQHGITTKAGERLDHGTGLSRPTIIRVLRDLKHCRLLVETDPGNPRQHIPPSYAPQLDSQLVDLAWLTERRAAKDTTGRRRMCSVRASKTDLPATTTSQSDLPAQSTASKCDLPELVNPIYQKQAITGKSHLHTITSIEIQSEIHVPQRATHADGEPPIEKKTRKPRAKKEEPASPIEVRQALADACKIDYTSGPKESKLQVNTTAGKLWTAAAAKGLTPEQLAERVKRVAKWIRRYQYPWTDNPAQALTPAAIHKHWRAAIEATSSPVRTSQPDTRPASPEATPAQPASPEPTRATPEQWQATIGAALAAARSGQ